MGLAGAMTQTPENEDEPCVTSWIYNEQVDSQAMLIAYLHWLHGQHDSRQRMGWHHRLYAIVHAGHSCLDMRHSPIPLIRCGARACAACGRDNGQWEFRWHNQAWNTTYEFFARPGAWMHEGAHRGRRGEQAGCTALLTIAAEPTATEDGSSSIQPSDDSLSEGW